MSEYRMPWNAREGVIYGCIIASLSSLLIGGFNVYTNMGYSLETFPDFLKNYLVVWPAIFLVAFILAASVVEKVSKIVVRRYAGPNDSTNAYICFNTIVCVLLMSMSMTLIGGIVGQSIGALIGGGTVDIAETVMIWPDIWPRNFCIAFWVEMLIAQPAARKAMVMIHRSSMGDVTAS